MMRRGSVGVTLAVGASVALAVSGSAPELSAAPHRSAAPQRSTASHHWTYHADVDGDGKPDTVHISTLKGFSIVSGTTGNGKYHVRVALSRSGKSVGKTLTTDGIGYYARSPWTPYGGRSHFDGRRGAELVLGHLSTTEVTIYYVLTYRAHKLREVTPPPGTQTWILSGTKGTSSGWKCIKHGMQRRVASHSSKTGRWTVERTSFVGKADGTWRKTHHSKSTSAGRPAIANTFDQFANCAPLKGYPGAD